VPGIVGVMVLLGGLCTRMEGGACCREGSVPGALEAKYIPRGLVKVNKCDWINVFIKEGIVIVI
jgi:hypothetical protein